MTKDFTSIAVAYGDGIGPEIMEAVLFILKEAKARLDIKTIEIGEKLYLKGQNSGISKEAWDTVKKCKVLLKAPITTPQGKGYKSLNVTFRKALGLFANVRPTASYFPFVESKQEKMDLIVVRENEEDLYAGVEYKPISDYAISYKIISQEGSEKIIRYAFEYARQNGRKKVTCFVKDNIMKIADGMFHNAFKEIAKDYPEIEAGSIIVDIGSARIASRPQDFDVIVTLNLYGDIISDIAAEVSGSVGLAGSSNIGDDFAMFEAVHGSAPDIAGKQIANPSGLLNGAVMMLEYIGQADIAVNIKNAWLKTIEDGIHTGDIYKEGTSKKKVSTMDFAKAVVENLGKKPSKLKAEQPREAKKIKSVKYNRKSSETQLIGTDVYLTAIGANFENMVKDLDCADDMKLHSISRKGLKIWPDSDAENIESDFICARYIGFEDKGVTQADINKLLTALDSKGVKITTVQNLYNFDKAAGFTMAQG